MKKLYMLEEEQQVAHFYAQEILRKGTSPAETAKNIVFQNANRENKLFSYKMVGTA
jgi:hypothetical protein